jgi:hypothetical protein
MKKLLFNAACSIGFVLLINEFLDSKEPLQFVKYGVAVVCVVIFTLLLYSYLKHFMPLRRGGEGFPYVYVEADGIVRELTQEEQNYLRTDFFPSDSGRPYLKTRYQEKDGWGSIKGFIPRNRVPARITISAI